MAGLCNLALHEAVKKVVGDAPYMKYNKENNFVEISLGGNITEHNINGVAHTTAKALNDAINNGVKRIGKVFEPTTIHEIIKGVRVRITPKQLALLDAYDDEVIKELQQEVDEENAKRAQEERDREIEGEDLLGISSIGNNIKEGVDFVFEQNPELANTVYEALGFKNKLKTYLGKELEYKDPYVPQSRLKSFKQYEVLNESGDNIGTVVVEYRGNESVILHPKLNVISKGYGKDLYKLISSKFNVEVQEWSEGVIANSDSAKKMWDSLEKEGTAKRIIDEEGDNFRVLNYRQQITPQQKQQAQQLYSQYLDTIFPDSKIKDIVYHGGKTNKDSFKRFVDKTKYKDRNPNSILGFFFSSSRNTVAGQYAEKDYDAIKEHLTGDAETDAFIRRSAPLKKGSVSEELLNIKNPYIIQAEEWENETWVDKLNILTEKDKDDDWVSDYKWTVDAYEKVKNHLQSLGYDGLYINSNKELFNKTGIVDYITVQKVVFEPEQIHILGSKQDVEWFKNFIKNNQYQQKIETEMSTASPETIKLIKDFLNRIGVDSKSLESIVVNGVKQDANGVALIMQKLIQVVEGKEASVLPEEAMHFAVELIEQNNSTLFNQLLKEINEYNLYRDVLKTYGSDKNYQTKEGKPDVRKLKKEAIAKVLAETIINKAEGLTEKPELLAKTQNWWQKIIDYFKGLFTKSGFDQAAMDIILGKELGELKPTKGVYFQKASQDDVYNKIKNFSSSIEKRDDGYYIDGKKVPRRVTDDVKTWGEKKFKNNDLLKSEYEELVDTLKKEKGTAGHADLEHAFNVFVDENGYLRDEPLDDSGYVSQINPKNNDMYLILKQNLKERLNSYPQGTRFLSEITVYSAKKRIAGTIDFLSISPEGKVNILDWKFMNLNVEKSTDIPWYKRDSWRVQMNQYKSILEDSYGLRNEDFGQTRMIPILAIYTKGNVKENILPELSSVKIGDVNVKNIEEDYLLPLGLETEKTGNRKIDTLIEKLNADYKKYSERQVTPEEKQAKAEHLNALFRAIRQLQIKDNLQPLLYEAKVLNKQINTLIEEYNNKFKGKDGNSFSEEEKSDFADRLDSMQQSLLVYTDLDIYLRGLFQGELSEDNKKLKEELKDTAENARDLEADLDEILQDFVSNIVVKSEGVDNFLDPEKIVKGMSKWFSSTATIQTKAIQFLYKKANKALAFSAMDTLTENKKLQELKESYQKWASSKGLTNKNYFDSIKKKGSNSLIDQYNSDFYSTLKSKIEEKDFKWIRENINVSEYNKYLKEKLERELERLDNTPITGNEEERKQKQNEINFKKDKLKALYNTSLTDSPGWLLYDSIKLFPKESWYSNEWKELIKPENKAAKDFYDYIVEKNKEYRKLGYISREEARIFLPYVRKSLTEKLITGGDIRLGEQFFQSISIDEGDIGYGKIDPHTGKPLNVIPKYFTNEIDGELSEDLFRNMSLYNEAALRYKYLTEVEDQIRLVLKVEQNKKAIATSMFGKTEYKDGVLQYTPDNSENSKLYEDMMKSIVYGQKFITSETFDQLIGKLGTWGEKFNEKLGIKVFPENLSERQVSVNKVMDNINNVFQLNILGLNLLSAGSNLFGGNAHSIINSSKYFTKKDYMRAELMLFTNKFNGEDAKKMLAALEYFLPLTDNYNKEIANKLSVHTLTGESLQEGLMFLMRYSDLNVQTSNFYAYLFNTIVVDGEVRNVREYLKSTPKYSNIYSLSTEQRKSLNDQFEEDVKSLIEEKGLLKVASVENNELVIPGVDRKHQSVVELRRKVQQISKNALGNLTEDDVRTINMNVYGKSFMVFKNWIPRLVDVRMGNLKYNSASDAYEWGRMRMIFRVLSDDLLHSVGNLKDSLLANEKGVEYMRQLFEKKKADYENDTGKKLEMTEDEFMDLMRQNIKSQIMDLVFLLTLCALIYGLKAFAPDDDEDPAVKSQYRFILKATDKFRDELMYFYNPTSLSGLVSTGIFPSVALITNFEKATQNFFIENWALATGNEKLEKDTKVIKYWMKSFPFTNQVVGYLPMFYPDLAKDLGVKIQSNYGIR